MAVTNTLAYHDAATITEEKSFMVQSVNNRQKWKRMTVANTLAYCYTLTITAVKSFMVQAVNIRQE